MVTQNASELLKIRGAETNKQDLRRGAPGKFKRCKGNALNPPMLLRVRATWSGAMIVYLRSKRD